MILYVLLGTLFNVHSYCTQFFSSVICLRQIRWGLFWFNSIDRFDSDCMKQEEKLSETGVLMCRAFYSIMFLLCFVWCCQSCIELQISNIYFVIHSIFLSLNDNGNTKM